MVVSWVQVASRKSDKMRTEEIFEHWLAQARGQLQRLPYASALPFLSRPVDTPQPADTWLSGRLEDVPKSVWLAVWPLALLAIWLYLKGENDQPIRYRVASPKKTEREEILSNPSIKVRPRPLIHWPYGSDSS